jgi:predicted dinucleotide-binding enzyme
MPREAALFGEVVLVSVLYHAIQQIGRELANELAGQVVLESYRGPIPDPRIDPIP